LTKARILLKIYDVKYRVERAYKSRRGAWLQREEETN